MRSNSGLPWCNCETTTTLSSDLNLAVFQAACVMNQGQCIKAIALCYHFYLTDTEAFMGLHSILDQIHQAVRMLYM